MLWISLPPLLPAQMLLRWHHSTIAATVSATAREIKLGTVSSAGSDAALANARCAAATASAEAHAAGTRNATNAVGLTATCTTEPRGVATPEFRSLPRSPFPPIPSVFPALVLEQQCATTSTMSSESRDCQGRDRHDSRDRHLSRPRGSDASSPHQETGNPFQATESLRLEEQESSGPDPGDHDVVQPNRSSRIFQPPRPYHPSLGISLLRTYGP